MIKKAFQRNRFNRQGPGEPVSVSVQAILFQRANDFPILNPSFDARELALPASAELTGWAIEKAEISLRSESSVQFAKSHGRYFR